MLHRLCHLNTRPSATTGCIKPPCGTVIHHRGSHARSLRSGLEPEHYQLAKEPRLCPTGAYSPNPTAAIPGILGDTSAAVVASPQYSLEETKALVETAMLAAVSGLAYVLSTILKLEGSLSYFLPMPIVLAALRPGVPAGWRTMIATALLLIVLLGPLRALTYVTLHGCLAATLGTLWRWRVGFWTSVALGAFVRMGGQLAYLFLSSVTMNENLFAIMLANVHAMLEQFFAAVGSSGAPSLLVISCSIFGLVLVNSTCYVILLHVIYRVVLQSMGFKLGPLPAVVKKVLNMKDGTERVA